MRHLTVHTVRGGIGLGALALLVAACGGSGNGTDKTAAAGGSASGDVVAVASVNGHDALVNGDGKTLYSASAEAGGMIRCVGSCTTFWVPDIATASQAKQASTDLGKAFGVVDRPDGESQLTYKGMPLYTFAEEGAGELQGNGFTDNFQGTQFVWSAALIGASGAPTSSGTQNYNGGGYGY